MELDFILEGRRLPSLLLYLYVSAVLSGFLLQAQYGASAWTFKGVPGEQTSHSDVSDVPVRLPFPRQLSNLTRDTNVTRVNAVPLFDGVSSKEKVELLGEILKRHVDRLRKTENKKVELVFLVDSSASVGAEDFTNELKFVRKLVADFTVDRDTTRVAVVTFSSKSRVVRNIDHLTQADNSHHKCSLLEEELPGIEYVGGGTYTLGAMLEAQKVFSAARADAKKVAFLITDGYSNGGDPRAAAEELKETGVEIFTFGIRQGNFRELNDMASEPRAEHTYILDTFAEFEALARRALHEDLRVGSYVEQELSKCSNLCSEKKDCCDIKALCRCGTHTGKYECVCSAGYHGSGLVSGCFACPAGTYKNESSPGDEMSCTPCPDPNHTSEEGSTSVDQCHCKAGYRLDPLDNRTCTAVLCPPLSLPQNAIFVHGKCENVVNAACGVGCGPGYRLVAGSSIRLCQDNGTWTGTEVVCEVKTCPPLPQLRHGTVSCTKNDFSYETKCHFMCDAGYVLVGSKTRTCFAIAHWDGIEPTCREITCKPLATLPDGRVQPPSCVTEKSVFGTICTYTCLSGYKLVGPYSRQCTVSGLWRPDDEAESKCKDVTPPTIRCGTSVIVQASEDESTAFVSWPIPTALDNSGFLPVVTVVPALVPPTKLPIGETLITYTAEDASKNTAMCSISVLVRDVQPPRVDKCVSPPPFIRRGKDIMISWEEPLFSDNSRDTVSVSKTHTFGQFPMGHTKVVYTALDKSRNAATCTIDVIIKEHACANPPSPKNGQITCKEQDFHLLCSVVCDTGHAFAIEPANIYTCEITQGLWAPASLWPISDCSVATTSSQVAQGTELFFESQMACDSPSFLNLVDLGFQQRVKQKVAYYCQLQKAARLTCEVIEVQTTCTVMPPEEAENRIDTLPRQRRSADTSTLQQERESVAEKRGIFFSDVTVADGMFEKNVRLKFTVSGVLSQGDGMKLGIQVAKQEELAFSVSDIISRIHDDARRGDFDITIDDTPVKFQHAALLSPAPLFVCSTGSVLRGSDCVKCPVGTFFNVVSELCVSCALGTYQPEEAQLTCLFCPTNTSTAHNQSTSVSQCKGQCLPGTFSVDGLEPCETCAVGFYQPGYADTRCLPCPNDTTTWRRGSRRITECGLTCEEGYVSKNGLQPCLPCPRGYFQPQRGKLSCFQCPTKSKTVSTGSKSMLDCDGVSESSADQFARAALAELPINECFAEPCRNEATCVTLPAGYTCQCVSGYAGLHCELEVDECLSSPCHNNGTCTDLVNKFSCECLEGFTGDQCEVNINDCLSAPCLHNATCVDYVMAFSCLCPTGYTGTRCEVDIDDCEFITCHNGGSCVDKLASFECKCAKGYSGPYCAIDINECASWPCLNNATCIDDIDSYMCVCGGGYTGIHCEVNIDECLSQPCHNGAQCTDLVNKFSCQCLPSFGASDCSIKLSGKFDLVFGSSGITDYLVYSGLQTNITEITVMFWIRTADTSNYGTVLSYATDYFDNAFTILDYSGFVLSVNGQKVITDVTANDNRWHHVAFMWKSEAGTWHVYRDGLLADNGTGLAAGQLIPGGGLLIVGQEQDVKGGGFSAPESFVGTLSRLNMWQSWLGQSGVNSLMHSCDDYAGSLVAWPDFLAGLKGSVEKKDSLFCGDCEIPTSIPDGSVEVNGTTAGGSAQYTCNAGFERIGVAVRTCRIDNQWSGDAPQCKRKNCGSPGSIRHGSFKGSSYTYGSSVKYECINGFYLIGNATLYCGAQGLWMTEKPRCEEVVCPAPPSLALMQVSGVKDKYRLGDTLRFSCLTGHRLFGQSSLTCESPGVWSSSYPTCDEVQCSAPPSLPNGGPVLSAVVTENRLRGEVMFRGGDTVSYGCNRGYVLKAPLTRLCLDSGIWSGDVPGGQCDLITCTLQSVSHANVTPVKTEYTLDDVVNYECELGYMLNGSASLICMENNTWNSSAPVCKLIVCPQPATPLHGLLVIDGNRLLNSVAIYSCSKGYKLQGEAEQVCTPAGQWTGNTPTCQLVSCPALPMLAHVQWSSQLVFYNTTVYASCERGYVLNGSAEVVCTEHGTWSGLPVQCQPVNCGSPPVPLHGRVLGKVWQYLSSVEYMCDGGYVLNGTSARQCLANASWSGSEPTCEQLTCPKPESISNGVYENGKGYYLPGNTLHIRCEYGYAIEGKSTRTCRIDGTWSGPAPKCQLIKCSTLPPIANGKLNMTDNTVGSLAEYQCDEGYELQGTATRECAEDHSWRGDIPSCVRIQCPHMEPPANGYIVSNGVFTPGSTVMFACDKGYRLAGSAECTCLDNKTWSPGMPVCQLVTCTAPPLFIFNGRMIGTNFTFNSTIEYECDEGFQINGSVSRTCTETGSWDAPIPVCERVECPQPVPAANVVISGSDFHFLESVTYSCKFGYELQGVANRVCQANASWSGLEPVCVRLECGAPSPISHGSVSVNSSYVGDEALYQCDLHHELDGDSVRTCQLNKSWSGKSPQCVHIMCPVPADIGNGSVQVKETYIGHVVMYECDHAYELVGDKIRVCQVNKTWTGSEPYCLPLQCPPPANISHGRVLFHSSYVGDIVVHVCDEYYELVGARELTCLPNKTWSGVEPHCVLVECPPPGDLQHGFIQAARLYVGDLAVFQCLENYELVGTNISTCQPNRTWSGVMPKCVAIECLPPANISNGSVHIGRLYVGDQATFQCQEHYELVGSNVSQCQPNRTWSGLRPECVRIQCSQPVNINFGSVQLLRGTYVQDEAVYGCQFGYELKGSEVITCLKNKTWSGTLPRCIPIECPPAVNISHGRVHTDSSYMGGQAVYACETNYKLVGNRNRTCLQNKTWSGSAPVCDPITCPVNDSVLHGHVVGAALATVGTNLTYVCDEGYEVKGDKIRQCLVTGKWQGEESLCVLIVCLPPSNISNGFISATASVAVGSNITYACLEGFELIGTSWRECLLNKSWSNSEPFCERILCPLPTNISHGHLNTSLPAAYGDSVTYVCEEGYNLIGSTVQRCQLNKTWSNTQPSCQPVPCPLLSVENSQKSDYEIFVYGDAVAVVCNVGYRLLGRPVLSCLSSGQWNDTIPSCQQITCDSPSNVTNAYIVPYKSKYYYGDSVTLMCNVGHELKGSAVRSCLLEGTWFPLDGWKCVPVTCFMPDELLHGHVIILSRLFGDFVTYICDDYYELVGQSTRFCQANRTWSGMPPTCQLSACDVPASITHGIIMSTTLFIGDSITYLCEKDYELIGNTARTCLENKTWSGRAPFCQLITCPLPTNITNGYLTVGLLHVGQSVTYTCIVGYEIIGHSERTCLANKTWSMEEPRCQRIACPSLTNISHGLIFVTSLYYGQNVTYTCHYGYRLIGKSMRVCQLNKTWTEEEPVCERILCPALSPPVDGKLSVSSYNVGGNATFECTEDYMLEGVVNSTCLINGTWSSDPPHCVPIVCPVPVNITNGVVRLSNVTVRSELTYSCDSGYELLGDGSRVCNISGQWSGFEPLCVEITCPLPAPISKGSVVSGDLRLGSIVTYHCEDGYKLNGSARRRCELTKKWSGEEPVCIRVSCPPIANISHGYVMLNTSLQHDLLLYSCMDLYELVGPAQIVCFSNGSWSHSPPSCRPVSCPPLSNSTLSRVLVHSNLVGGQATYSCVTGYKLDGLEERTCLANKTWSGEEPSCVLITCPPALNITNGTMVVSGLGIGNAVTYQCDEGFVLEGSSSMVCTENGTWNGSYPECVLIVCLLPPLVEHSSVVVTGLAMKDAVTYTCNVGFKLVGFPRVTCLSNGTWSGPLPQCVRLMCDKPSNISNGFVKFDEMQVGSETVYECSIGYELRGANKRVCQQDETWSGSVPTCHRIFCSNPPPAVDNARTTHESVASGERVPYWCITGYVMAGEGNITCSHNGSYIGQPPVCEVVSCSPPKAPLNGSFVMRGQSFGMQVAFLCDEGFELIGFQVITCTEWGQWSNREPSCRAMLCPQPRDPINGRVITADGLQVGQEARYTCFPGHVLLGPFARMCTSKRVWSGTEPSCLEIRCPSPRVRNGFIVTAFASDKALGSATNIDRFVMGMSVKLGCDEGFELTGVEESTCTFNSTWSPPLPLCERVKCQPLNISHSPLNGNVFSFNKRVTVTCDSGYIVDGFKELYCQANGTWSVTIPKCTIVTCPEISFTQGKITTIPSPLSAVLNAYGTVVKYSCKRGFTVSDRNDSLCTARGVWSHLPPQCVPMTCDAPVIDSDDKFLALVNLSSVFEYGDVIKFQCMPDYELQGSAWLVCGDGGLWQGNVPRCISTECEKPQLSDNVHLFNSAKANNKFVVGDTVLFECANYHLLVGSKNMTCLENRLWSASVPSCVRLSCHLPPIDNSLTDVNSTLAGTSLNVSCLIGYELDGPMTLTCNTDGTWSSSIPNCVPMICSRPTLENGYIALGSPSISEGYTFGDIVQFDCDIGYRLVGEAESMCMPDKSWSSATPLCEAVTCPLPPLPKHGYWDGENRVDIRPGMRLQLQCDRGYRAQGSREILCSVQGTWHKVADTPTCTPIYCSRPEIDSSIVHAAGVVIIQKHNFSVDDVVTFTCVEGYVLEGPRAVRCEENGVWNTSHPLCLPVTCPNPSPLEHGTVHVTLLLYKSKYFVSCDEGYELDNAGEAVCEATGKWSVILGCKRASCPLPTDIRHGFHSSKGHLFSDRLVYWCKLGYELVGDAELLCLANGSWSGSAPSCAPVKCPSTLPLNNTRSLHRLFAYAETVAITCETGYELIGSQTTAECLASGQWTAVTSECRLVECPKPPNIDRGKLVGSQYTFNSTISYQCEEGFELAGQLIRRCLETKRWSGATPSCVRVTCLPPESFANGYTDISDYTYGSNVTYHCNMGYQLVGQTVRTCQANGQWSGDTPYCRLILCPTPSTLANGRVLADSFSFNYGSVVQYSCNVGFELAGDTFRVCLDTAQWSGLAPECRRVVCPPPPQIDFGRIDGTDFKFGNTVTYKCSPRYYIVGNAERTCQADKTWSGITPYCRLKRCSSLPRLEYGQVIGSDVTAGASVTFRCYEGRQLVGESRLTCEGTAWSSAMPRCEKVSCGSSLPLPNTVKDTGVYGFGDVIIYKCLKGYIASGNPTSRCLSSGRWSDSTLKCLPISCRPPPFVVHGHTNGSVFVFGDTVYYSCEAGYKIQGSSHLYCTDDGQWRGEVPVCGLVHCGTVPVIQYATTIVTRGDIYGSRALYTCNKGYVLHGHKELSCTATGRWGPEGITRCVPIDCGTPPTSPGVIVLVTDTTYGNAVTYVCPLYFRLEGNNAAYCDATGQWNSSAPTCIRAFCSPPPPVSHGGFEPSDFAVGNTIHYYCEKGYVLIGDSTRLCEAEGYWTGDEPTCERINCGQPPEISNTVMLVHGSLFGDQTVYSCEEGYVIDSGNDTITCLDTGFWSNGSFVCRVYVVDCGQPPAVNGAEATVLGTLYGDITVYTCNAGFFMDSGNDTITCQENSMWSTELPVCSPQAVDCGPPPEVDGALMTMFGTLSGDVTVYSCMDGYILYSGNDTVTCLDSGSWSTDLPVCLPDGDNRLCSEPILLTHDVEHEKGYPIGTTVSLSCMEGYRALGDMAVICQADLTWTQPTGICQRVSCGLPKFNPQQVILQPMLTYDYGTVVVFRCRSGLVASKYPPTITCQANGLWDHEPECKGSCKNTCNNGGQCVGFNRCKCAPGYGGPFCDEAICILPCLNGAKCTGPYQCGCLAGYTGSRCETPVCDKPCLNGGRCYQPNKCQCPFGFWQPYCSTLPPLNTTSSLILWAG